MGVVKLWWVKEEEDWNICAGHIVHPSEFHTESSLFCCEVMVFSFSMPLRGCN